VGGRGKEQPAVADKVRAKDAACNWVPWKTL